ncbi:MAG TPA: hypothetical protein VJ023_07010 [Pyrinomonadaceae bacterium]|nr:hypothetical protein [Pyrinomonadaceae bacterium]
MNRRRWTYFSRIAFGGWSTGENQACEVIEEEEEATALKIEVMSGEKEVSVGDKTAIHSIPPD